MPFPISAARGRSALPTGVSDGQIAALSPHLWLDPSDLSKMFQSSGGTGAVAADSDPVGKINDKSGNGNHFTQATSGLRPLYKTSGGLRWLQFDGVDDALVGPAMSTFITTTTFDLVCAGIINTITENDTSGQATFNDALFADSGGIFALLFRTGSPQMKAFLYDGSPKSANDSYTAGAAFVAHMRHDGSGNLAITQNARSTVTAAVGTSINASNIVSLGRNRSDAFNVWTDCKFYGLISRKTTFGASDLALVKTYLGTKVGLVL